MGRKLFTTIKGRRKYVGVQGELYGALPNVEVVYGWAVGAKSEDVVRAVKYHAAHGDFESMPFFAPGRTLFRRRCRFFLGEDTRRCILRRETIQISTHSSRRISC